MGSMPAARWAGKTPKIAPTPRAAVSPTRTAVPLMTVLHSVLRPTPQATANPDDHPGQAPHDSQEERLHQELDQDVPAPGPHGNSEPHLVPAFPHRKEHDREDPDPAHQKGYASQSQRHPVEGVHRLQPGLKDHSLVLNGEVVGPFQFRHPVPGPKDFGDLSLGLLEPTPIRCLDIDHLQVVQVEHTPQGGLEGDDHLVVLFGKAVHGGPFALQDTDDLKGDSSYPDGLPQGIVVGEEKLSDPGTQDGDPGRLKILLPGEVASLAGPEVPDLFELRCGPQDLRHGGDLAELHPPDPILGRSESGDFRSPAARGPRRRPASGS